MKKKSNTHYEFELFSDSEVFCEIGKIRILRYNIAPDFRTLAQRAGYVENKF